MKLILNIDAELNSKLVELAVKRNVSKSALTRWALSRLIEEEKK
jgi:predicted transcriptional regulator